MLSTVKSRLYMLAFVPLLVFFCATFILFQFHVRELVVEDYLDHVSSVLNLQTKLIDQWLTERKQDISTLAVALSGHTHSDQELRRRLSAFLPYQSEFFAAGFADPEGNIIVRTDYSERDSIVHTDYFRTAAAGAAVVSEPYTEPVTQLHVITCAAPVYDRADTLTGVIFGTLDLEKLQYRLRETTPASVSDTYILDITGTLITEPARSSEFTKVGGRRFDPVLQANIIGPIFNAAAAHKRLDHAYTNYAGRSVFGGYRWFNNGSWLLVGETRAAKIHARYSGFTSVLLIILFVAFVLIFTVVISLNRTIAVPLHTLEREMQQVKDEGSSDLRPHWKLFERAPVEIRSLAYSFHTMEEQITAHLQELKRHTITDHLTKLYNRRHLFEEGYRYVHMIRRTRIPLACLIMDIDHFKDINDTYGHAVGDQILRDVSSEIRENIRETDFPARYGGEEFVILAYRADREQAMQLASRVRENIELQVHHTESGSLQITVSIGVALLHEKNKKARKLRNVKATLDRLLRIADDALYAAKDRGRNCIYFGGTITGDHEG